MFPITAAASIEKSEDGKKITGALEVTSAGESLVDVKVAVAVAGTTVESLVGLVSQVVAAVAAKAAE